MLDLLHLPEPDERTVWFPGQGASTNTTGWRVWTKPRGVSMVGMVIIGSGQGGSGGQGNNFTTTVTGGDGGSASGAAHYLWLASSLPDRLYVLSVGGGTGGAGGTNGLGVSGIAGAASLVSVYPNTTAGNILASSSTTIAALGQMACAFWAHARTSSGLSGVSGDRGVISVAGGVQDTLIINGLGGGGRLASGTGQPGGGHSFTSGAFSRTIQAQGTAQTGQDAPDGLPQFGIMLGGSGGGGNSLGVGGKGGDAKSWGAGGGGGGGGLTTGGAGGAGGPGLVIIKSW